MDNISFKPISVLHTPFKERNGIPRQAGASEIKAAKDMKGLQFMKLKNIALLTIVVSIAIGNVRAQEIVTRSPDGKIGFIIHADQHRLAFSIQNEDNLIIDQNPISITINGKNNPGNPTPKKVSRTTIDQIVIPTIPTIDSKIREYCNETLVEFENSISLRIRCYNDAAAYRWESSMDKQQIIVNAETLSLHFAHDWPVYYPVPNGNEFFSHQENEFLYKPISQVDDNQKPACVPVLFELDKNRYMLLTDVNVEQYPGMWITPAGDSKLNAVFPHYPAKTTLQRDRSLTVSKRSDYIAKTSGTRSFPWRAFLITNPEGLLSSITLYTLADPCRLKETSWIKPGKVAWDWWNAWNITDVPFKAGINQATYKNYIDFASANNLHYVILDEGWSVRGPDNLLEVVPELDIAELVQYGKSKNVGVILWMTSVALERSFDKAFVQFTKWGIKGLKVDFMQRDDQIMMDFCQQVAVRAAEHKLIVDFHGGSKPTGLQRTYPHVLTHESVLGLEQSKWSTHANPEMAVLLPFIRMVVGPMDYTPGAMDNFTKTTFKPQYKNPGSLGTRCHQLAMYIIYLSPLQMLADTPTKYRKNPESMKFLSKVPTTWDETVICKAKVGKQITLARRHGSTWYLAAMTNWTPREFTLDLDFLEDQKYTLTYWADGPDADQNPTDTTMGSKTVTRNSTLKIKLAPGGGYAAILKIDEEEK